MTAKERAHKVAEYISDRVAFGGILKINFQDEVERHITEAEREAREKAEAQLISARDVIFYSDHQKFCPKLNCEPGHNCTCGYSAAFAVYESYASAGQSLIDRLAAAERLADLACKFDYEGWTGPGKEIAEARSAYEALKPK